jgi:hypothetical protein
VISRFWVIEEIAGILLYIQESTPIEHLNEQEFSMLAIEFIKVMKPAI